MRYVKPKNLAQLENNDMNSASALVKHVYSQNHHMDWNKSKILAKETDYTRKKIFGVLFYSFLELEFILTPIVFIQLLIII